MTSETWVLASGIIFAASFIQALTGFGFGLVAVPLLLFVLPSQVALMIGMILAAISSLLQGFKTYKQARWDLIYKLILLSLPGLMLGVLNSNKLDQEMIKGLVGVVLILYVAWQGVRISKQNRIKISIEKVAQSEDIEDSKEKGIRISWLNLLTAGFSSGILNGLAAIPGPPIVALLVKYLDKDRFQATTTCFFALQYIITIVTKFIIQKNAFNLSFGVGMIGLILPIFLGLAVGQPVRKRINEENFKKLVYSLLFIIGITSVWEPLTRFIL